MPRVKRGVTHTARRKRLLKQTKGFKWARKNQIKAATTALSKAGANAFVGRKVKKRTQRAVWQTKINAAVRLHDLSYSKFINLLKVNKIEIDRKILAELAANHPKIFTAIVKEVKK